MTAIPPAVPIAADDFAARSYDVPMELENGRLKVLPMPGFQHGKVCYKVALRFGVFIEANALGHVATNDTYIQTGTNPDTVRGADLLFISYDRLPRGQVIRGVLRVAPELAIEVKSPTDEWGEVFTKVQEYLRIGVMLVLVLDPEYGTASVYQTADSVQRVLTVSDTLTLPEVPPGFSVAVRELFD